MPIHDWSDVPSGLFHHFHQDWSTEIARALNRGRLPKGFSALVEQKAFPREADVLAVESHSLRPDDRAGGVVTLPRPRTRVVAESENAFYARKANRVAIRHNLGTTVAVIEIVSPGNKDGKRAFRDFVDKTIEYLQSGVHVVIVDLFPPTPRDPAGIHKAVWDELEDVPFELPPGQDRVLVSYECDDPRRAYIETIGIGEELPDMPLYLAAGRAIAVPLAETYETAWMACPEALRELVAE